MTAVRTCLPSEGPSSTQLRIRTVPHQAVAEPLAGNCFLHSSMDKSQPHHQNPRRPKARQPSLQINSFQYLCFSVRPSLLACYSPVIFNFISETWYICFTRPPQFAYFLDLSFVFPHYIWEMLKIWESPRPQPVHSFTLPLIYQRIICNYSVSECKILTIQTNEMPPLYGGS